MQGKKQKTGVSRLLEIAGSKKWYIIAACVLGAGSAFLQFFPAVLAYDGLMELVKNWTDLGAVNIPYMIRLAVQMLACFAGFALLLYPSMILSHIAAFNILYSIRIKLAAKLSRLSLGYFNQSRSGVIKQVMSGEVENIELFVAHHTVDIVTAVSVPVIAFIIMATVDWRLMIASLLTLPLSIFVYGSYYMRPESRAKTEQYYREAANLNGSVVEFVNGMPVLKVFNATGTIIERITNDIKAHSRMTREWSASFSGAYAGFLTVIGSPLSFIIPAGVALSFFESDLTVFIPKFIFFLLVGGSMNLPLHKLMYLTALMNRNVEGVKHIDEILNAQELPETKTSITSSTPKDSSIEFEGVHFSYGETEVLHGISFRAESGSLVGLVGPSGGGKTTIAQLAARFWDINSGHIRIGGVDVRDMPISRLMESTAFVFQDVYMFRDTIENNIRMGNTSATMEDVKQAARAAQSEGFILAMQEGYQTVLGEGASRLSGGEMQRIAIARAILKNAPIIILDEATAYADAENESKIQAAFSELIRGKTVLIIAHRLSAIRHADQILVIDRGHIVEQGKHDKLVEKGGLYKRMVELYKRSQDWTFDTPKKEGL
ncbi:MAG: ABC transporter ATP-binding protein/permease [Spirochaetaceae bacterium]|jgi:ATP-binding cassette subfamily B protein|nr:ABC transporter ATP-binding protein/permease [Spirochaetaceae bacterium]